MKTFAGRYSFRRLSSRDGQSPLGSLRTRPLDRVLQQLHVWNHDVTAAEADQSAFTPMGQMSVDAHPCEADAGAELLLRKAVLDEQAATVRFGSSVLRREGAEPQQQPRFRIPENNILDEGGDLPDASA